MNWFRYMSAEDGPRGGRMRKLRICLAQSRLMCLTQALAGLVCSLAWPGYAWGQPATSPSWGSTTASNLRV